MKNIIYKIFAPVAVLALAMSCDKQDDTYRQYVVNGGYNYPAKATEVHAKAGYNRVAISWATPLDPAVKKVKLSWDNGLNVMDVDYAAAVDGVVTAVVDNLEERSYTFNIVNYDGNGNKSLPSEITVSPYADGWLSTHAERRVTGAFMEGNDAAISLGPAIDEMVYTQFRYKDVNGDVVVSEPLPVDSVTAFLPNALKGKLFEYRSAYMPADGLDFVWSPNWTKCDMPILYRLSADEWDITVTTGQMRSAEYAPSMAFDGNFETRYYSSTNTSLRKNFPKIIAIDTKAEADDRPVVSYVRLHQHATESKSRFVRGFSLYVGDAPYDPNDASYMTNYAEPALDCTFTQADAMQQRKFAEAKGRYYAVVFKNSFSTNGFIDVLELELIGYVPSQAN